MKLILLVLSVLSLAIGVEHSIAEEPTLEQTIKFIEQKCNIRFEARKKHDYRIQKVFIKDCVISTNEDYPLRNEFTQQSVSLKDLDPTRIEINDRGDGLFGYRTGLIYIYTTEDKHKIRESVNFKNKLTLWTLPGVHAEKVAKAMAHLIKLCGGKGEIF